MHYEPGSRATAVAVRALLILGCWLATAATARAEFTIDVQHAQPVQTKAAMAYSDFGLTLGFPRDSTPESVQIDLPEGQLAVLSAASLCTRVALESDACTAATQIGRAKVLVRAPSVGLVIAAPGSIYRIPTRGTEAGRLGIVVRPPIGDKMLLDATLRIRDDGTYGIRVEVHGIPKTARLTVVPGLPPVQLAVTVESMEFVLFGRVGRTGVPGFFFNPAECVAAVTHVSAVAWDGSVASDASGYSPTDCASVPFSPSIAFAPSPSPASTPVALRAKLTVPFDPAADRLQAPLREARIVLPPGVQLSGAANSDGALAVCTPEQFHSDDLAPVDCPAGSQVGSVALDSPLIGAVPGRLYLAGPKPGPDEIAGLFVVAELGPEQDAVRVKLTADVEVDPVSGDTTGTLVDLPAQPVRSFEFSFRGGTAPVIRQPRECGTYVGAATVTPFSSPQALDLTADYVVSSNCPAEHAFAPSLAMAVTPSTAGAQAAGELTIVLPVGDEPISRLRVSLPPGVLANLQNVSRCTAEQMADAACPGASRIGGVVGLAGQGPVPGRFPGSVYLADAGDPSSLATLLIDVPVRVGPIYLDDLEVRASLTLRPDYGVDVEAVIPQTLRGLEMDLQQLTLTLDRPDFLINPPTCEGNEIVGVLESSFRTTKVVASPLTVTGCDAMEFSPSIAFSSNAATVGEAPSFTTTVSIPPTTQGHGQSPAKSIAVTLPDGVTLSPSAGARGDLAGCSAEQFAVNQRGSATCPSGSQVGTAVIETPSVGRLSGQVFLGDPGGSHLAQVFLEATSDRFGTSTRVKLAGVLDVDEASGRTTATFRGLPPIAFTKLVLVLRGGDAPVLALPTACGPTQGSATLQPFAGVSVRISGELRISGDCGRPAAFAPTFALATDPTQAAANTSLTATVKLPASGEELKTLEMLMPPGLLGQLTVVPPCPLDRATAGTCGPESLVGTVTAAIGVASAPYEVRGSIYMTEGSAGTIAGLALSLPAKLGPIDLGQVNTLAALRIVGPDLQMQVTADAVPTQIRGIPLQLREVSIAIDRAGVVLNGSSCQPQLAVARFISASGTSAEATGAYQATGCERLRWTPTMGLDFTGTPPDLAAKGHPTVRAQVLQPSAQGNLRAALITLPAGVATDAKNVASHTCPSVAAAASGSCEASIVGQAVLDTPAFARPINASIYLAAVPGLQLPGILIRIRDQVEFDALGLTRINAAGRIQVTFADLPDAPITSMALTFSGGPSSVLTLARDICASGTSDAVLTAQHGAQLASTSPVRCNGKASTFGTELQPSDATAQLAVRPNGRKRGFTLVVKNRSGVKAITFTMPKGFSYAKGARSHISVSTTGSVGKVSIVRIVRGRSLTVRVSGQQVRALKVAAAPRASRFARRYVTSLKRTSQRRKLKASLLLTDDAARTLRPPTTVKVSLARSR